MLRFLVPENASLAQGLLQIILDNAQIEIFSPKGGGVAVIRLERWQIDVLADFGVCFEEKFSPPASQEREQLKKPPRFQREHIATPEKYSDLNRRKGVHQSKPTNRRFSEKLIQDQKNSASARDSCESASLLDQFAHATVYDDILSDWLNTDAERITTAVRSD